MREVSFFCDLTSCRAFVWSLFAECLCAGFLSILSGPAPFPSFSRCKHRLTMNFLLAGGIAGLVGNPGGMSSIYSSRLGFH